MKTALNGMTVAAFGSSVDGLWIGDVKAKMAIDIVGVGWQQRVSTFDGGDRRRWPLVFAGGDGRLLWQQWTVNNRYGVQWRRWRWRWRCGGI
jgi:hypothetical protein